MKIHKNTWHYRLWHATHLFWSDGKEEKIPTTTSLCAYVRWLLLVPILMGLAGLVFGTLLLVVNLITILSGWGYAPFTLKPGPLTRPFYPLVRGLIWLAEAVIITGRYPTQVLAFLHWWTTADGHGLLWVLGAFAGIVALIFLIVATAPRIAAMGKSDTAKLIAAYLKARKNKVCPLVSFEA